MSTLPLRRWLQFRLSTWFVLVAIVAWAMLVRPTIEWGSKGHADAWSKWNRTGIMFQTNMHRPGSDNFSEAEDSLENLGLAWFHRSDNSPWMRVRSIRVTPKSSLYSFLALAAFVGWKAVWAIGRQSRMLRADE